MDFSYIPEIQKTMTEIAQEGASLARKEENHFKQVDNYRDWLKSTFDKLTSEFNSGSGSRSFDQENAGSGHDMVKTGQAEAPLQGSHPDDNGSSGSNTNVGPRSSETHSLRGKRSSENTEHSGHTVAASHSQNPHNVDVRPHVLKDRLECMVALRKHVERIKEQALSNATEEERNRHEAFKAVKDLSEAHETRPNIAPSELAQEVMRLREKQIDMYRSIYNEHLAYLEKVNELVQLQKKDPFFMQELTNSLEIWLEASRRNRMSNLQ